MKKLFKAASIIAVFSAAAANAATFDFSYTWEDGQVISGSLNGELNGDYLENISDIHATLNGTEFVGSPLFAAGYDTATNSWSKPALISTNAALNNFAFGDVDLAADPYGASNYFYFSNSFSADSGQVVAFNFNTSDAAFDGSPNASWKLTQEAPVPTPLPDSAALMMSGIGLVGAISRLRRRLDGNAA